QRKSHTARCGICRRNRGDRGSGIRSAGWRRLVVNRRSRAATASSKEYEAHNSQDYEHSDWHHFLVHDTLPSWPPRTAARLSVRRPRSVRRTCAQAEVPGNIGPRQAASDWRGVLLISTETTLLENPLATARSCFPSPLKSPTTTDRRSPPAA